MKKNLQKDHSKTDREGCSYKIIVIEDDEGLNYLIRKRLIREGFQVDWASNGKEALSKITGEPSEILLIDYKLPDLSGKELIEKLVKNYHKLPHFITMTGFGDEKIAVDMMKLGALDYFVKEANFIDFLPEKLKQICLLLDKTRRLEEAEETIRNQSQLLKETGQMAKVGGWELNLHNNTVLFSETTKRIHEVPSDYLPTLQEAINFYPPETRPVIKQAAEKAIKDGEKYDLELPFQTAKGHKLWVYTIGMPEMKDGKCVRLHGIFQDITTRKQHEKQLLELNSQLSLAQNIAKLGYWTYDIKNQLPTWTDECFRLFNIPKEKGEPYFPEQKQYIHPDDWDLYDSSVQKAITADVPYDIQIRLVHNNGDIVWMRTKGFTRKNSKGEVTELFGMVQDITDLKKVEIEIEEARIFLNEMAKTGKIGGWQFNPVTLKQIWTDEVFRIFEIDTENEAPEVPQGMEYIDPEFRPMAENGIQRAMEFGESYTQEWIVTTAKGNKKWVNAVCNPKIINGKVVNLYGSIQDISERKQIEIELLLAKEKAEESDRLKSAFLANMSHEIRTPMNAILGFTDLLLEPDLSGEDQQEFIEVIQRSSNRMLSTLNDIVDISKIESGFVEISVSDVNINEQLKYYHSIFKPEAAKKGLELTFKNNLPEQDIIIQTDPEKFNSILMNLIKNAIKYTKQGFIELGCNIKREKELVELEFYVKDSGIGIPNDRQAAIFERFIQADIEDRHAVEGSGLGLAISKAYAEMLGGDLRLESEEGVGSTFYFKINTTP